MAFINFKLQDLDKISPFTNGDQLFLHWFALTDGNLWLELKGSTIYEYTNDAVTTFDGKERKYNDYYISRFIEDFTELFESISESVPESIYNEFESFGSFHDFLNETREWLEKFDDEDHDFYEQKYFHLISWLSSRSFDSAHLTGGPYLWFIRKQSQIKIIWDAQHQLSPGSDLWTSPFRLIEMDYSEFVKEVEDFGTRFFEAMSKQIQSAVKTNFKDIQIDKVRLIEEQEQRQQDFFTCLAKLKREPESKTNWKLVEALSLEMREDLH